MRKIMCIMVCIILFTGIISSCGITKAEDSDSLYSSTRGTINSEQTPFNPDTLDSEVPLIIQEAMKVEAIRYLFPKNPNPENWKYEVKFTFYGIFEDIFVLMIDPGNGVTEYETGELVDGFRLVYPNSVKLYVYADGKFYRLGEAMEEQIIDHAVLETVVENYYSAHPDRVPDPTPGEYSDSLSDELRAEIEAFYGRTGTFDDEDTVAGMQYYGTYNGYVILLEIGMLDVIYQENIHGRLFKWGTDIALLAYKNGKENYLKNIYEAAWITDADLDQILAKHKAYFATINNWDYDKYAS